MRPISSRFVYQIKRRIGNTLEAFCRWTPRGFEEQPGVHYDPDNIFAATPQTGVIRFIFNRALSRGDDTFHIDFKRAFSHSPIDKRVHVRMPKGYEVRDEDGYELVLCLDKSSEGLKQSAAMWSQHLSKHLRAAGFEQCEKEPCLWRLTLENGGFVA
jgi:hypothetical protein